MLLHVANKIVFGDFNAYYDAGLSVIIIPLHNGWSVRGKNERERERERECVCVCVCVKEREIKSSTSRLRSTV